MIISYQMGKVASSAITESIDNCYQIHSLDGEEPIKYFSSRYTGSLKGRILQYIKWKYEAKKIKKKINEAKRVKLIIGIREPISRNISGFFQTLTQKEKGKNLEEYINMYFSFCPHMASSLWFESELEKHFNINIYDYDFDKNKGCSTYVINKFDIFIYQFEKLDSIQNEIGKFLNNDKFELSKVNSADGKWLKNIYSEFKMKIEFPCNYLDLLYSTRFVNHFYSENDINNFKMKWHKNSQIMDEGFN